VNTNEKMMEAFKGLCYKNKDLAELVHDLFNDSAVQHSVLSNVLLDLVLYNRTRLTVEATNMIHRHYSQRQELKTIYM
jgi:hypothetical protein